MTPHRAVRHRPAVLLAWTLVALVVLLLAGFVWVDQLTRRAGQADLAPLELFAAAPTLALLGATVVGAVVASRRPRHPVGWLLLGLGLDLAVSGWLAAYLPYALIARPGTLPGAAILARYYAATPTWAISLIGFVLLLTPTGTLLSSRWRWWARVAAVVPALLVAVPLLPGRFDPVDQTVKGPLAFSASGGLLLVVQVLAFAVSILALVVAAASLAIRFRRARGAERQQLRWVAFAAAVAGVAWLASALMLAGGRPGPADWFSTVGLVFPPFAIGAAILRYRLYDLDRIISRTVGYGVLTLLLGGGYGIVVLGFGQLLGQGRSLVVAGATLAVAAAFQPARRRVQALVDRRFDRRRYDAARTIDAFTVRLREHVDLDALTTELLAVIEQTTQPAQASLWLRYPAPTSSAQTHSAGSPRASMAST